LNFVIADGPRTGRAGLVRIFTRTTFASLRNARPSLRGQAAHRAGAKVIEEFEPDAGAIGEMGDFEVTGVRHPICNVTRLVVGQTRPDVPKVIFALEGFRSNCARVAAQWAGHGR